MVGLSILWGCAETRSHRPLDAGTHPKLTDHTKIFKKGVERVTDNVYVAIGFGLANAINHPGVC